MQRFCEGADQDFYVRNNLLLQRQDPKNPFISYNLDPDSILINVFFYNFNKIKKNKLDAILFCANVATAVKLSISIHFYSIGALRVFIGIPAENRLMISKYVVQENMLNEPEDLNIKINKEKMEIEINFTAKIEDKNCENYKSEGKCKFIINCQPFRIFCYYNTQLAFIINDRQLFNYERYREREPLFSKATDMTDLIAPLTYWEQQPLMHKVQAPKGPSSVALDFSFNELPDCYGLAARSRTSLLENTITKSPISIGPTTHPYRLYGIDNYEDKYVNQSMYGNVPFIIGNNYSKEYNVGLLWLNASDTYIDVEKIAQLPGENSSTKIHITSECGTLEFFVMLGKTPQDVNFEYGRITGIEPLPQYFTLGYHQCRWDKDTQKDYLFFSDKFEEIKMPCDCMWLDIEHTDDKRYFTWDKSIFPDPVGMIKTLNSKGRNLVVIVDPHIKIDQDYYVYKGAYENSIFLLSKV